MALRLMEATSNEGAAAVCGSAPAEANTSRFTKKNAQAAILDQCDYIVHIDIQKSPSCFQRFADNRPSSPQTA
jgi:hypothetical protein